MQDESGGDIKPELTSATLVPARLIGYGDLAPSVAPDKLSSSVLLGKRSNAEKCVAKVTFRGSVFGSESVGQMVLAAIPGCVHIQSHALHNRVASSAEPSTLQS